MHAPLSKAQQRGVAPCGAVPCPALRCCVVLRCAFIRTYSSTRCTCCSVLLFLLFLHLIFLGSHVFSSTQITRVLRSERYTANEHRARSTGQFGLMAKIRPMWRCAIWVMPDLARGVAPSRCYSAVAVKFQAPQSS